MIEREGARIAQRDLQLEAMGAALARPGFESVEQKPILKMGDTSVMYALAEVYETDVLWVRPGQQARVTSSALPQALTGTVERIGRMIFKNDGGWISRRAESLTVKRTPCLVSWKPWPRSRSVHL